MLEVVGGGGGAVVDCLVVDCTELEVVESMKDVSLAETCELVPSVGVVVTCDSGPDVVDWVGVVPSPSQKKRLSWNVWFRCDFTWSSGIFRPVAIHVMQLFKAFSKSDPGSHSAGIMPSC